MSRGWKRGGRYLLRGLPFVWAVAAPLAGQEASFDLATLFDQGHLVTDENGDGVPDGLGATLVLPPQPTDFELAAAAEVSARLGFETSALDLPLGRGVRTGAIAILIGEGAFATAGLSTESVLGSAVEGPTVAAGESDGQRWLALVGRTGEELVEAARLLAGSLPHTRTLSDPTLAEVGEDVARWLEPDTTVDTPGYRVSFHTARSEGDDGVRLSGILDHDDPSALVAALSRLDSLAATRRSEGEVGDSATLRFEGVTQVSLAPSEGGSAVTIPVAPPPPEPGPVPGRPGSGARGSMDLSNVYGTDGALADSDNNEIPDRVDVILVPGSRGADLLPELAARLGLESTGLTVPLSRMPADIESPASEPTTVLVGLDNPLTEQLADSGRIDLTDLEPGDGLLEIIPKAFGGKPALVVTGTEEEGSNAAARYLAETLPHLSVRGLDTPTLDHVEEELWALLSGHSPAGQASIALYKLDRILEELADAGVVEADVLVSLEKPEPGLETLIRERFAAAQLRAGAVDIDDRDVQRAAQIFGESLDVPSEVDRFRAAVRERLLPAVRSGAVVNVEARLSEPPELRDALASEIRDALVSAGADPGSRVRVLSAFKQGFFWLDEVVKPKLAALPVEEVVVEFLRNDPPEEWPQQAMHTPVRWLHEIFPIDEVLARDLDLPLDRIRFEMVDEGPVYRVSARDEGGREILTESFEPKWVLRPYFDRFDDYEQVRVTTGWITATVESEPVLDERIVTDPEWVWDHFQSSTLPAVYDYVMDRHEGNPRGGGSDAPFFGELTVEVELSEPDYRLGIDNEIISTMDALHEEVYFGTIEFFHLIGRNARGADLTYPGRVLPVMRPRGDGRAGSLRTRLTGFATQRPAVVVRYRTAEGDTAEVRLDIPKVTMERPSVRRAVVRAGETSGLDLSLRVRVNTELDVRDSLLTYAPPLRVDESMISAEQVATTLANLESLRAEGSYATTLAFDGMGSLDVWAEWTHEQDPESRVTARLEANGTAASLPRWADLLPEGWHHDGGRLVQWDTPIPPPEGHEILAKMAETFDEAAMHRVGESYLGKTTWALELAPPVTATHRSLAKGTTFKPTVVYSARQHANEVSSTSHVLRHAELLLTDPEQRRKLDRVNVIIHPFTNPDGAQLAYDLYRTTPDYILHAGYLGSLGMDATSGSTEDFPIYPESKVRGRIWERWLPDIFLNPHGYPSHQVVQLFSEYTGLVRRGRVTERNWGFNKGWFMPGFGYVDDPRYPSAPGRGVRDPGLHHGRNQLEPRRFRVEPA